jgi:hypothetical protein
MNRIERRREVRRPANGGIHLVFEDPVPTNVSGRLMDISESGFRAHHTFGAFRLGQLVSFRHPSAEGHARVMWNRVLEDHVETGFLVVA